MENDKQVQGVVSMHVDESKDDESIEHIPHRVTSETAQKIIDILEDNKGDTVDQECKPRKRARTSEDFIPVTPDPSSSEKLCLMEASASTDGIAHTFLLEAALCNFKNVNKMQSILERMHQEYQTLAQRYTCLTNKLSQEQENCHLLKDGVDKIQRDILELKTENESLKSTFGKVESQIRCQICFEKNRNTVLMPCLHFLFCKSCIESHFQSSEARLCPICRNGVSGTLELQLEH